MDFLEIANQAADAVEGKGEKPAPTACPTCGKPVDDVPNPDPKKASEFSKGASENGDPLYNLIKKKLGY